MWNTSMIKKHWSVAYTYLRYRMIVMLGYQIINFEALENSFTNKELQNH